MNFILYPVMLLAGLGLALSVAIHGAALLGIPVPGGHTPWGLHLGIFVVWMPTVLVANRMARGERKGFWKIAFAGCPAWMRWALYALFAYAVFNFVHGALSKGGAPVRDGQEVLRMFSGHWMVFYGAAFGVALSALRSPHLLHARRCPQGHEASPLDAFCPRCGMALAEPEG